MSNGYHLSPSIAGLYARGGLSLEQEASIEAHVLACSSCQELVGSIVPVERLEDVWVRVVEDRVSARWRTANSPLRPLGSRWVEVLQGLRMGLRPVYAIGFAATILIGGLVFAAAFESSEQAGSQAGNFTSKPSTTSSTGVAGTSLRGRGGHFHWVISPRPDPARASRVLPGYPDRTQQLISYYNAVASSRRLAWKQLGVKPPSGFDAYEAFWSTVQDFDITHIDVLDSGKIDYVIAYHFSNGRDARQDRQMTLDRRRGSQWVSFTIVNDSPHAMNLPSAPAGMWAELEVRA